MTHGKRWQAASNALAESKVSNHNGAAPTPATALQPGSVANTSVVPKSAPRAFRMLPPEQGQSTSRASQGNDLQSTRSPEVRVAEQAKAES
jgi:hypothetical protein